jgi:hypothetical protein
VFSVRYELDLYILFRGNSVFKGLSRHCFFLINSFTMVLEFLAMNSRDRKGSA